MRKSARRLFIAGNIASVCLLGAGAAQLLLQAGYYEPLSYSWTSSQQCARGEGHTECNASSLTSTRERLHDYFSEQPLDKLQRWRAANVCQEKLVDCRQLDDETVRRIIDNVIAIKKGDQDSLIQYAQIGIGILGVGFTGVQLWQSRGKSGPAPKPVAARRRVKKSKAQTSKQRRA